MNNFESLSSKKVTDTDLKYLESKIQFTLPYDYKIFLKEYNGAIIKKGYICSFPIRWCSEKRDVLQGMYCIDKDKTNLTIDHWIGFYRDEIVKNGKCIMIPIGATAFGSTVFLKNNGKVILADYSHSFRSSIGSRCLYKLADSFSDFIKGLMFEK